MRSTDPNPDQNLSFSMLVSFYNAMQTTTKKKEQKPLVTKVFNYYLSRNILI